MNGDAKALARRSRRQAATGGPRPDTCGDLTQAHGRIRRPGSRERSPGSHDGAARRVMGSLLADAVLHSRSVLVLLLVSLALYNYVGWVTTPASELTADRSHDDDDDETKSPLLSGSGRRPARPLSLLSPYILDYQDVRSVRAESVRAWRGHGGTVPSELDIDRRANLSMQEFWDVYDGKWSVLLTDVVPKWPAYNWTGEFLNETYGQERVTMKAVDLQLDAAITEVFSVLSNIPTEVLHVPPKKGGLSQAVSLAIPLHMFYKNTDRASPSAWTYVEDELFIPMRPELKRDIGHTPYLEDDYFKLFPEEVRPWDAMLLWGTKYSRSSLHMDPYNWTGTNAVIRGKKWWKLFPPGQDQYLYIKPNQKSGFPLNCYKYNSPVDAFDPDLEKYPLFGESSSILFEQLPGELLIIPSGWYHQAYNGDETLAISGQVMNSNNYRVVLEEIIKAENVRREQLPPDIDKMAPKQQVEKVLALLPDELLLKGKTVTENVLHHIQKSAPDHLTQDPGGGGGGGG